jgi:hypothetical protein
VIEEVAESTSAIGCEGLKTPTYTDAEFDSLSSDAVEILLLWDALWADVCE